MNRFIRNEQLKSYREYLAENEKSKNTVEKYLRDLRAFIRFASGGSVDKLLVLRYKEHLSKTYAVSSANSMLAALNAFFRFAGWEDCRVKQFKLQRPAYCPAEKELTKAEYIRLVKAAETAQNTRLRLIIETICATGIRVSELCHITVEAAQRGEANVRCKGKSRTVFLVKKLRRSLLLYAKQRGIMSGAIFLNGSGKPLDRTSVWKQMKRLSKRAKVRAGKIFPHNLRHLFARTFYAIKKDLAKLADVLGHTNINTTRIYVVTTGEEHRRLLERMQLIS